MKYLIFHNVLFWIGFLIKLISIFHSSLTEQMEWGCVEGRQFAREEAMLKLCSDEDI